MYDLPLTNDFKALPSRPVVETSTNKAEHLEFESCTFTLIIPFLLHRTLLYFMFYPSLRSVPVVALRVEDIQPEIR